jgi:DNA ligase-1
MLSTHFRVMKPFKGTPHQPIDIARLRYPVLATPKIDGIRCVYLDGSVYTASNKPIPNDFVRDLIMDECPYGLDGELVLAPYPNCSFQATTSAIMSKYGAPAFKWLVFDIVMSEPYATRADKLRTLVLPDWVYPLTPIICDGPCDLQNFTNQCLDDGYEGVCFRSPESPYKCGRSTLNEQYLCAIKPYADSEALVTGFIEANANTNAPTVNERGLQQRSHASDGMVPKDTLGALVVFNHAFGKFEIGTGFSAAERSHIWRNKDQYLNRPVTFKYQAVGTAAKPRQPVFKGFRDPADL